MRGNKTNFVLRQDESPSRATKKAHYNHLIRAFNSGQPSWIHQQCMRTWICRSSNHRCTMMESTFFLIEDFWVDSENSAPDPKLSNMRTQGEAKKTHLYRGLNAPGGEMISSFEKSNSNYVNVPPTPPQHKVASPSWNGFVHAPNRSLLGMLLRADTDRNSRIFVCQTAQFTKKSDWSSPVFPVGIPGIQFSQKQALCGGHSLHESVYLPSSKETAKAAANRSQSTFFSAPKGKISKERERERRVQKMGKQSAASQILKKSFPAFKYANVSPSPNLVTLSPGVASTHTHTK